MKFEPFQLEREQSIWENKVDYNLSESGVHPGTIKSLFDSEFIKKIENTELTYGFTEGSPELRQSIASIYPGASPENVQAFNGSAEANMVAILTLLEPGNEMVYMVPNYLQIYGFARGLGVNVKTFSLHESLNWQPDLDELKSLVTNKTKMICICNPNNPTGAVLPKEMVHQIGEIAQSVGAWILSDEVYRGAELNREECTSFWDLDYEKTIVNCGLSKAYGLPGLRIGWSVASTDTIQKCWATHDYTSIAIGRMSDIIAAHVLHPTLRMETLNRTRDALTANLGLFQKWISEFDSKMRFIPPEAGAMAFAGYDWNINSTKLIEKVREEASVMLVAGDWYGMDHYLRFGYGAKQLDLEAALDRITPIFRSL
ncbi:MAG: aminotransferase class I/II-fold pyridoxal phosphate-dependent enzyme [Candidatus Marinimicrobia bacterium]|nr:aminotransferase class I/II-fold pyridoxal phosphate-dependent enzyme [Candidatus Neomarinimicrobiota bacterium]MBL7010848.1 aminotransferase class I/II-fold pyridoxal phosphate-dependent enzyme [Candidatus Neomarinimicrobiota bacterium]MBL7031200.1 aminotransferase class I/II-fold pyridoxal phosphate-dependent enzyme [Candidatus Neomarinimicrobiota bacterium]